MYKIGLRKEGAVEADDLLRLLDDAELSRAPEDDRLQKLLDLGDEPLLGDAAAKSEELDLVVPAVLGHARKGELAAFEYADEFAKPADELVQIRLRKRRKPGELGKGEEVDAADGMAISESR